MKKHTVKLQDFVGEYTSTTLCSDSRSKKRISMTVVISDSGVTIKYTVDASGTSQDYTSLPAAIVAYNL